MKGTNTPGFLSLMFLSIIMFSSASASWSSEVIVLPVINPNFEENTIPEGTTSQNVAGWNTEGFAGLFHPLVGTFNEDPGQVAFADDGGEVCQIVGPIEADFIYILQGEFYVEGGTETLAGTCAYNCSAANTELGNNDVWSEILAGSPEAPIPPPGEKAIWTLTLITRPSDPFIGQIGRICGLSVLQQEGATPCYFDNFTATAQCAVLFKSGFESGDVSEWSSAQH